MKYSKALYSSLSLSILLFSGTLFADEIKIEKPTPEQVIQMLKDGNKRFVQGKAVHPHGGIDRRALANKENQAKYAFATIVSCSDSRVPPELIFDTGIMDLFVIRIAGNICNTDEAGSIEYGLFNVNTPLLIIMGHSKCGAVTATAKGGEAHGHIGGIVKLIAPAVNNVKNQPGDLVDNAIKENARLVAAAIASSKPVLGKMVEEGKIAVIPAYYDIDTGLVEML